MRTTLLRILKNGAIVAVGLTIIGALFGQVASMWVASQAPIRSGPVFQDVTAPFSSADAVADQLKWRAPLAMAGWGVVLVTVFELLGGLWRKPKPEAQTVGATPSVEAEEAVQKFLREAEVKSANLADTPAPAGLPGAKASPVAEVAV